MVLKVIYRDVPLLTPCFFLASALHSSHPFPQEPLCLQHAMAYHYFSRCKDLLVFTDQQVSEKLYHFNPDDSTPFQRQLNRADFKLPFQRAILMCVCVCVSVHMYGVFTLNHAHPCLCCRIFIILVTLVTFIDAAVISCALSLPYAYFLHSYQTTKSNKTAIYSIPLFLFPSLLPSLFPSISCPCLLPPSWASFPSVGCYLINIFIRHIPSL